MDIDDWYGPYDDRDPEPPDDDQPPLNLDEVTNDYEQALNEDMSGIPEHCAQALAAVPELLARLRAAETELSEWRKREHRYEYAITDGQPPTEHGVRLPYEEALVACERPELGTPWARTISTSPWGLLEAPPF
ncbi:hypothetical protein [Streptosporangium roseum]|uniref:hypothetical protein n=1 Tax=Streptosporangium roseum TaxID=2001 RepID=UPI0033309801